MFDIYKMSTKPLMNKTGRFVPRRKEANPCKATEQHLTESDGGAAALDSGVRLPGSEPDLATYFSSLCLSFSRVNKTIATYLIGSL